jgi:hypothetical protein
MVTVAKVGDMKAWPLGAKSRREVLRRIARHRNADEIVQGIGFDAGLGKHGKGCAIGCSLNKYDHNEYVRVLGVPLGVARLVDRIHDGLPRDLSLDWPGRVAKALTVAQRTDRIVDRYLFWMLDDELKKYPTSNAVADLYRRRLAGDEPKRSEWSDAADAAAAARWSAAAAAADAAAAAAAAAARCAAAAAAADAAAADAAAAARKHYYARAANALIAAIEAA